MKSKQKGLSVKRCCSELGYARSSYYKALKSSKVKKDNHSLILRKVYKIRNEMPKIGTRKIHYLLRKELLSNGTVSLGRDRLFDLLRQNNMLIIRKRKYAITTDSNHPFKKYSNLIKAERISRVNQVWVSDITYVKLANDFCYVSLITDLYSRKIIGYHVCNTLELSGPLRALKNALKQGSPEIHHSDRGSQYCSYRYTGLLKKHKTKISMTENGNCYENAVAERINGILKGEYNLSSKFETIKQVRTVLKQAVLSYNNKRPHWALNFKVPSQVYKAA